LESGLIDSIEDVYNKDELVKKLSKGKYSLIILDYDFFDLGTINEITELIQNAENKKYFSSNQQR